MARAAAILDKKVSTPTLEVFDVVKSSVTSVGTTALPVPATNLSFRNGIMVQNLDTSKIVHVGVILKTHVATVRTLKQNLTTPEYEPYKIS